ncbi:hypothetical protein [Gloeobacter violaceus]|uniref:Glr2413 protein n=1 Tax=Gloeobacter violaceus (strain ATCC 29082 / PCC 7421) TaxID=251221 RepID=Q7NHX2_GLOVI|nr:hypothetical protein [Gloeobacter violaceus]BAC90354.1 glr2413 [Gloeobacter violaceus PCC 7421]
MEELLRIWSRLEPERCRLSSDGFEIMHCARWHPTGEGALIVALLEACDQHNFYYDIERIPVGSEEPIGNLRISVGVQKVWQYREGDRTVEKLPELLLSEYLDHWRTQILGEPRYC